MSNPNMANAISILGKIAVANVTDVSTIIVENAADSNSVIKLNALYVSNSDGSNDANVSIDVEYSSTNYPLIKYVVIPAGSTVDVFTKSVYLEEGYSLKIQAESNLTSMAVCSYEVIS